ncbi:MAG: hypothetical protein ACOZCL_10335 [Bacillota bacterium]
MYKKAFISILLIVVFVFSSCSKPVQPDLSPSPVITAEPEASPEASPAATPTAASEPYKTLLEISNEAAEAFLSKDMDKFSSYVDPQKGLRFSMCGYINTDSDLIFSTDQLSGLFDDTTKYAWGPNNENGDPIIMNAKEYFDTFIYKDYVEYSDGLVLTASSPTISNEFEVYPDARVIKHNFCIDKTTAFAGITVHFVFERNDYKHYISNVVIIENEI